MDGPAAGFMLLTLGAVSIIAAIVGDGTKLPGNVEFPSLKSRTLRVLLGMVGAGFMFLGAGYVSYQGGGPGPVPDNTEAPSPYIVPNTQVPTALPTEQPTQIPKNSTVVNFAEGINAVCRDHIPQVLDAYNSVYTVDHGLAAERLASWRDELRSLAPSGADERLLDPLVGLVGSMADAQNGMSVGVSYDWSVFYLHQGKFYDALLEYRALVSQEPIPSCQTF